MSFQPLGRDVSSLFLPTCTCRDASCGTTIHEAFTKADHPERIKIGIVEQNCHADCRTGNNEMSLVGLTQWSNSIVVVPTGTGWAETRRIVDAPPDVDCLEGRCSGNM